MDGEVSERLEDFVSSPLVTWVQTVEGLLDSRSERPASPRKKQNPESPKEYFLKLVSGDFLICIMEMIDMIHNRVRPSWNEQSPELYRLQILQILLQRLNSFYQNDLQQQILSIPPNIYLLAQDPLTAQAIAEMKKLLLLLLGCAVQCEHRDEFIGCIQTLDISTQAALVSAIQEVTQEPQNILRLNWKETGPTEAEQLLQKVASRIQQLVHERDAGLEKLWELQQEQKTQPAPPPENNQQHLGVQLAEVRAQVRHLRHELEEKMEELLDQQDEQKVLEDQLKKLKQENQALAAEARLAVLYRDEVDVLQEKALRTERLQAELAVLRERLPALEQCRAQLKEEREFSQALLETKAVLEGQVEAARSHRQHLSQVEKETLRLQSCLKQVQEEREQLYQQVDALLRENAALERQLRKSLAEPPELLRAEEMEHDWALEEPSGGPFLLSYEIEKSDRLLPLEQENQELRRKLHKALESKDTNPEAKRTALDQERKSPQSQTQQEMGRKILDPSEVPGQKGLEGLALDERESQRWKQEKVVSVEETELALSELRAQLQVAERQRESESHRVSDLEDAMRILREDCAAVLEKREQEWSLETQHLREEIQALERDQEALRAGSRALQAAAAQAQSELSEARHRLQEERSQGSLAAQKARQAEEDLCAAQRELEALHRSQEQRKVALAQLEAEKAALEEMLSQAENRWRQAEKEARQAKVQNQAQGVRLVLLEAQTREQAAELSILQEVPRHRPDLEREAAENLGGQAHRGSVVPPFPDPEAQLPVDRSNPKTDELTLQTDAGTEAPSARVIEVERKNAVLQADKLALTEKIDHLETQFGHLRASHQGRSPDANEDHGQRQAQNSVLQVEAALLRSQQALLESQLSEMRQRLAGAESEGQAAQREREEWRGRYETLLRDHDRLTVLHERQGADLEGLLAKHRSLKGTLRSLEQEYRDLQSRLSHLMGQKTDLEQREEAFREQKKRLEEEGRHHRELVEHHSNLEKEHERVKQALSQMERARDDLQGELPGMRNRITGLQLEQARLGAESAALKEQNQQLDTALGRLSTQCELLAQLKGNQEEENRHLLDEIQSLSRENRRLLERSMESREHFQEEQRQYLDKLGELRREKQKLVEKIMDQYRVLEPALPRGKKSNWIAEKIRKLMKPRREAVREQLRPMAEGAGSTESLSGQEGQGADGTVPNSPSSLSPLRKTSSSLTILDAQQIHLRRRRLSSHMPVTSTPEVGNGEGQDTPRQRFRQRRLGMLGGSREEAIIATAEWQAPRQEKRGPPLGEEEKNPTRSL